jgi:hypothetical protein
MFKYRLYLWIYIAPVENDYSTELSAPEEMRLKNERLMRKSQSLVLPLLSKEGHSKWRDQLQQKHNVRQEWY